MVCYFAKLLHNLFKVLHYYIIKVVYSPVNVITTASCINLLHLAEEVITFTIQNSILLPGILHKTIEKLLRVEKLLHLPVL